MAEGPLLHLLQFLRAPGTVAEPLPSSASVGRAMADQVDFARARTVLEYGPGTGVVTRELLKRLRPEGRLVTIELSQAFADRLRSSIQDSRLHVVGGSAEEAARHLAGLGVERVDAVVSSLPFSSMPLALRRSILERTRDLMAPGATFVAMQYVPFVLLPLLRATFSRVRIARWCPMNLPPLFVLVASDS